MFDDGQFFKNNWFVVCHELVHFCSRVREDAAYFADPEESLGFVFSVATEMARGTDVNQIWNLIYPRIEFHFHNESDAREFFMNCIQHAKKILAPPNSL
jgi:hypothetical protein